MKPLTFESIRNFLRTKKKTSKDGAFNGMDSSFKRSDSFKRISIRKSYLDRGRKRAALRAKALGATTVIAQRNRSEEENENLYEKPQYLETNLNSSIELIDLKDEPNDKNNKRNISTTNFIYNEPVDQLRVNDNENDNFKGEFNENEVTVKEPTTKSLVTAIATSKGDNYSGESIVIRISADQDNENECIPPTSSIPSTISSIIMNKHQQQQALKKESIDSALENLNTVSSVSVNKNHPTFEIRKQFKNAKPPPKPPRKALNAPSRSSSFSEFHFQAKPKIEARVIDRFKEESADEENDYHSFVFHPEVDIYDDANVMSTDSSIPYPLRVKTNPFTMQKELYAVNLGRIWKQLNLGQEDCESTNNVRRKNESFKSMSSKDSGFSLTLTKPDFSYPRRDKIVICRNSCKRRKQENRNNSINNGKILKEFEEFCIARRNRLKNYEYNNFILNKEWSDLEAFFEEHLQRLKKYYMQKKNLNERILHHSPSNLEDFVFPHPDKRNRRQTEKQPHQRTHKQHSKLQFQEVRTFLNEECTKKNHSEKSTAEQRTTYEIFNYPKHWRMTGIKNHNSSRISNRYKRRSFGKRGKKTETYKSRKEICLENVFPSINDIKSQPITLTESSSSHPRLYENPKPSGSRKKTCWICYKNKPSNKCKCNSLPNDCDCSCTSDATYHQFRQEQQQLDQYIADDNYIDVNVDGDDDDDVEMDVSPAHERRRMHRRKSKRRSRRVVPANKNHLTLRRKRGNISNCEYLNL